MKQRKVALLLAVSLVLTQTPVTGITVAAEDTLMEQAVEEIAESESTGSEQETVEELPEEAGEEITVAEPEEETEMVISDEAELALQTEPEGIMLQEVPQSGEHEEEGEYYIGFNTLKGSSTILTGGNRELEVTLHRCDNEEELETGYSLKILGVYRQDDNEDDSDDVKSNSVAEWCGAGVVKITAGDKEGAEYLLIKATIDVDDGKTIEFTEKWYFTVSGYEIEDVALNADNLQMGETIDLSNMKLMHYENGNPVPVNNAVVKLDNDYDGWLIQQTENPDLPYLTRNSKNAVWFTLIAYIDETEITRRYYNFASLNDDGDSDDGDDSGDEDYSNEGEKKSPYVLQMHYQDTIGNGVMLPKSNMTISTELIEKKNLKSVENYRLKIEKQPRQIGDGWKESKNTVEVVDGKRILVTSADVIGSYTFKVSVQLWDETEQTYKEAYQKYIDFEVSKYMLSPQKLEGINPKVGEELNLADLNIQLLEYQNGNMVPVEDNSIKIICGKRWMDEINDYDYDYDTTAWEIKSGSEEKDLPILIRKSPQNTWVSVIALKDDAKGDTQIARLEYRFDAVSSSEHMHSWEHRTTINATCTTDGSRTYICRECGQTKSEMIPKTGHKVVEDPAVAPTLFAKGKTAGSHCAVCNTVLNPQKEVEKLKGSITLTDKALKMKTGQSTTAFKAYGLTVGDYVTNVISDNPSIVKVSAVDQNGTLKLTAGKKAGSANITVTLASNTSVSFKVTVQKKEVKTTGITTATKKLTLNGGETYKKLAASVSITPVTSKEKITYTSSNKKVATVDKKGVIKAIKAGTAKITIKSGSKKTVCTVKVLPAKTTQIKNVSASKTLKKGKTFQIKPKLVPSNSGEKVTYSSSDKKIVTVTAKGVVKGKNKGTATITVKSGKVTKTCKVTVK